MFIIVLILKVLSFLLHNGPLCFGIGLLWGHKKALQHYREIMQMKLLMLRFENLNLLDNIVISALLPFIEDEKTRILIKQSMSERFFKGMTKNEIALLGAGGEDEIPTYDPDSGFQQSEKTDGTRVLFTLESETKELL